MQMSFHNEDGHQFGNIEIGDWFRVHDFIWMKVKPTSFGNCIRLTSDTVASIGAFSTLANDVIVLPVASVEITFA